MEAYLNEQEQLEAIKKWFKHHGFAVACGIVLAICASWGWHQWQMVKERAREHASVRYEELLTSVAENDETGIHQHADYLISRYPRSDYAKLAKLLLARLDVNHGELQQAKQRLQDVVAHGDTPAFRAIAKLRLARLWLTEKQSEQALTVLQTLDDQTYAGLAAEVKGDIYLAQGQHEAAKAAYQQALLALPGAELNRPLLQMKLDNLMAQGVTP